MPDVHARLSASGAKKWMLCTPSVRLEEQFPDKNTTYAAEGTFAHTLAELILRYNNQEITKKTFSTRLNKLKADPFYNQELQDYVEDYAGKVWEIVNETRAKCPDALVLFEQRLDFFEYVPGGFGTGDVVIVADDLVNIIDLKFGQGVGVSAENNPQLRLYGIGAYLEHSMLYDIKRVRMTIIQPRLENLSTEELSAEELLAWAETEVKPRAALAMAGEGEFAPCEDACRFCKAKALCQARKDANMELAKLDFAEPELLSDEEIGEVLRKATELASWVKDITEYAFNEALNGKKFDGWKLVEGRSNRKYTDETAVADTLKKAGYDEEKIYGKKPLLGITAMEKVVGKKDFGTLLGNLIVKPEGKPTLVPESDRRPEISTADSAKDDFAEDTLPDGFEECRDELLLLEAIPPHRAIEHYLETMKEKYSEAAIREAYKCVVGEERL